MTAPNKSHKNTAALGTPLMEVKTVPETLETNPYSHISLPKKTPLYSVTVRALNLTVYCSCPWDETMSLMIYTSRESHSGIILKGKTEELRERPVPVPLCPQIPHGLTRVLNPSFRYERPATNHLSHSMA
jgi:hypothetical protein